MSRTSVFPLQMAVHSLGVARTTPRGVATRSAFGPYVEGLADRVERLTVVAYDPPEEPKGTEDLTEFEIRPQRGNIELLSLGPKGSWRDYPSRARRVSEIMRSASPGWDVLLFRVVNRRANLVFRANLCPRVVTIMGGSSIGHFMEAGPLTPRRMMQLPSTLRLEWHHRRIVRGSQLVFANGEQLVERYRPVAPGIRLLRSSARRARYAYLPPDRLDGPNPRFLIAGQIKADKGVFEALDSFEGIRRTMLRGAELHVAGIGVDLPALEKEVARRGLGDAVSFHGWVPGGEDFFSLLRRMDVLLCLSWVESFPRVVWESLAHGVLVICTAVGSLPLAFEHRQDVMLVPVRSAEAVQAAVADLLEDTGLRQRMLRRGFERAKEATVETVTGSILEQIADRWPELAGRRPSG